MAEHPWSLPVTRHEVPETGRHFELVADEQTRKAVAALAGVRAVSRLSASFEVVPHGRDGLRVTGRVCAGVEQSCVVTLEPIENEIDETVRLVFAPNVAPPFADDEGGEVVVADNDDSPEPLIGGGIDLGAIATEFLILGIDPYPRKPDAAFAPPVVDDDTANPFSALAALKPRLGRDEG
jgi:uncharacterized metal-binding protein YceD (DUF177 family)